MSKTLNIPLALVAIVLSLSAAGVHATTTSEGRASTGPTANSGYESIQIGQDGAEALALLEGLEEATRTETTGSNGQKIEIISVPLFRTASSRGSVTPEKSVTETATIVLIDGRVVGKELSSVTETGSVSNNPSSTSTEVLDSQYDLDALDALSDQDLATINAQTSTELSNTVYLSPHYMVPPRWDVWSGGPYYGGFFTTSL